jgi:hypothetical protein
LRDVRVEIQLSEIPIEDAVTAVVDDEEVEFAIVSLHEIPNSIFQLVLRICIEVELKSLRLVFVAIPEERV